jgi:hypothetical protein
LKNNNTQTKIEIFKFYNEVKSTWEKILPSQHHLLNDDLLVLEQSKLSNLETFYVNYKINNNIEGIFYFQLIKLNTEDIKSNNKLNSIALSCLLNKNNKVLVCGNLFRVYQEGYYITSSIPNSMLFKICIELKNEIYKKKDLIGMLIKDCPIILNKKSSFCDPFVTFDKDVTMVLNLNKSWTCIDDYCNDLTRKYKQRFKKIKKSAESLTIKSLSLEEIIVYGSKMESLYLELVNKQMITIGTLNSSYFINMKKVLNEKFDCFGFFKDEELIAFSSHIYYPSKNEMEIHYIGINGQLNNQYQLYFNILCHGIETAINQQYNTLELGRTAKEAKANMGAVAQVNQSYVWLSNGIFRSIFKYMSSSSDHSPISRQPFKKQKVNEEMVEHQVLD